jgi:hypothetical protein
VPGGPKNLGSSPSSIKSKTPPVPTGADGVLERSRAAEETRPWGSFRWARIETGHTGAVRGPGFTVRFRSACIVGGCRGNVLTRARGWSQTQF